MSKALMISLDAATAHMMLLDGNCIHLDKRPMSLVPPFKIYVYELKKWVSIDICQNKDCVFSISLPDRPPIIIPNKIEYRIQGKGAVIGEFLCDRIQYDADGGCDVHVSDLRVYSDPIPKYSFCKPCGRQAGCYCDECKMWNGNKPITRTPSPFLYVESLQEAVDV